MPISDETSEAKGCDTRKSMLGKYRCFDTYIAWGVAVSASRQRERYSSYITPTRLSPMGHTLRDALIVN